MDGGEPAKPADEEDEAGREWARGVDRECAHDLDDPRQDICTWEDEEPVDLQRRGPVPSVGALTTSRPGHLH
jgi:hypothetical protein